MRLGVTTAKYLIFLFNFTFFCMGLIILILGVTAKGNSPTDYHDLVKNVSNFNGTPVFAIIVGFFISFVSFFGCYGAIKENRCMLYTFATMVSVIFVCELIIGIAAYVFQGDLNEEVNRELISSIGVYGNEYNNTLQVNQTNSIVKSWDDMQQNMKCCGVHSFHDWKDNLNQTAITNIGGEVPISCCIHEAAGCNKDPLDDTTIFKIGCMDQLKDKIQSFASTLGFVGLVFAFLQLTGIVFSCCLASSLRDQHY